MDKLEKILMPMADVLTKNRVLIAIRDGFLISTPLLIVGPIFLLIATSQFQDGMLQYHQYLVLVGQTGSRRYLVHHLTVQVY